ncbi:MAG: A24 family peptidase [Cocleimonas sp.]|nr:A24 family peptidase [Cocleimonas sp.]
MEMVTLFRENSAFFLTVVGFFSLLVGSFLNAAIYRIPIMLQREWREECEELIGGEEVDEIEHPSGKKFNLFIPRSQCPTCGHMITALENIPVISYLFLGGKCSSCKTKISIQYPIIELFTALLSVFIAWKLGVTWQTLAALFFTWTLITLSLIDAKTMLLPDNLTLPLMWIGIAVNYQGLFVDLQSSVLGAMIGYMSLWSLFHVFKLITGKDGMGYGDFKILAAIGAWGGWQILPFTIFAASLLGAVIGILWMIIQKQKESQPIPFGPWLALAGFIGFLWRTEITQAMANYFMLG